MRWLRAIAVWVLLMSGEVVHGVARTLYLAPAVGDFRARQLAVFSGSLLILSIATLTIRWLQVTATRGLVSVGVMWVVLTLAFEIGLARLFGYSWGRIVSDYDLLHGGLMPIGLGVMALSPWMASRLRRRRAAWNPVLILMLIALVAASHVVGCVDASAIGPAQASCPDAAQSIRDLIDGARHPLLRRPTSGERQQLTALYASGADAPLWIDAAGRPNPDARDALALLTGAAADGLEPADYDAATLAGLGAQLDTAPGTAPNVAVFDVLLSLNTLAYFRQVHAGRVDPRTIGFRMTVPADGDDFAALLRAARVGHRVAAAAADLAPRLALYRRLRGMLARYRSLAADPALEWSPPAVGAAVHPGQRYAEVPALHRRLRAFGDVPADAPAPAEGAPYGGVLVDGVTRFQIRHGLQADGVIGHATQAALRVPLSWRVRQIELALERLRWLPHLGEQRFLAVNIPMFRLWAWDGVSASGAPSFGTGVIVGRALNTQTPVFVEEMRDLIFRPYWNVPTSILRHEILPALVRDADYLQRHEMEIVAGQTDVARTVALSAETMAGLRSGALRVRQRPGPKNALGLVKFVFPNDSNVYLHGTPAPELFSRARRDFSHGCVRVEDPTALAEWALQDHPEWTRDRILAAMNDDTSRRVHLTQAITVILFYITAVVMPEDDSIYFAEDIYRHDGRLDRALTREGVPR